MPKKKKKTTDLALTLEEMSRYEVLSARLEMHLAEVERWKAIEKLRKKEFEEELNSIRSKTRSGENGAKIIINERNELIHKIEERLEVDLKLYSIAPGGSLRYMKEFDKKPNSKEEKQEG